MANKHTPGPWFNEERNVYTKQGAWFIASMPGPGDGVSFVKHDREAEANAQLIAAAPEMLAALVAIEDAIMNGGEQEIQDAYNLVTSAIRKAKGGTNV